MRRKEGTKKFFVLLTQDLTSRERKEEKKILKETVIKVQRFNFAPQNTRFNYQNSFPHASHKI